MCLRSILTHTLEYQSDMPLSANKEAYHLCIFWYPSRVGALVERFVRFSHCTSHPDRLGAFLLHRPCTRTKSLLALDVATIQLMECPLLDTLSSRFTVSPNKCICISIHIPLSLTCPASRNRGLITVPLLTMQPKFSGLEITNRLNLLTALNTMALIINP